MSSARAVPPIRRLSAVPVADDGEHAILATRALPGVAVAVARRGGTEEWDLVLLGGGTFGGVALRARPISPMWTDGRLAVLGADDIGDLDRTPCAGVRSVLVAPLPGTGEGTTYLAMDHRAARRQLQGGSAIVPGASTLDELTLGILWALANLDDALLADDTELTECRRLLRTELWAADISITPELVAELSATSYGWLGSDCCARYIVRATETFTSRPVFWTREQRGEEASSWLFFRHKLDYLRLTSHRFGSRADPVVRDFCIPEETVHTSPLAERVLVLPAAALMESLGIRTQVCTDPQLSTVDGSCSHPARVRSSPRGSAPTDAGTSTVPLSTCRLRGRHQACGGASDPRRAKPRRTPHRAGWLPRHRLGLDHAPLPRTVPAHVRGLRPTRSRLLSTEGVDAACRYLAQVPDPAA